MRGKEAIVAVGEEGDWTVKHFRIRPGAEGEEKKVGAELLCASRSLGHLHCSAKAQGR